MPNLADDTEGSINKLLLEGDSGTGKTTALATLVEDGFKLRLWDFDDGRAGLVKEIKKRCPDKLRNVEYVLLRDKHVTNELGSFVPSPTAFIDAAKYADKWTDGTTPSNWGPEFIAVFDSLTHWSDAANYWAKSILGASFQIEGSHSKGMVDPRNIVYTAQRAIINQIAALTSASFNTNLIVISHIKYTERQDGTTRGYPMTVGSAIGPEILTYFNNHVLGFESRTDKGGEIKRIIRTKSTYMLDLKTGAAVPDELDAQSGLSKFFRRPHA